MRQEVTLTDITRMHEGRICIAGIDQHGRCVRPIVPGANVWEGFLTSLPGHTIRRFSRLSLELAMAEPDPPHTEDRAFNPWSARYIEQLDAGAAHRLLEGILDPCVEAIFGAPIREQSWVQRGEGLRSLGTVRPREITEVNATQASEGMRLRLGFIGAGGAAYRLAVTDLSLLRACRQMLDTLGSCEGAAKRVRRDIEGRDVLLRIGLARGWAKHPDRCYLQITGVYS